METTNENHSRIPDELTEEIKKLNTVINRLYKKQSFMRSFVNGVFMGLGSVVGATLVVAVIVYLLNQVNLIPVIGNWLSQIISEALTNLAY